MLFCLIYFFTVSVIFSWFGGNSNSQASISFRSLSWWLLWSGSLRIAYKSLLADKSLLRSDRNWGVICWNLLVMKRLGIWICLRNSLSILQRIC